MKSRDNSENILQIMKGKNWNIKMDTVIYCEYLLSNMTDGVLHCNLKIYLPIFRVMTYEIIYGHCS